jgi:hypothetical protein
MNNTVKTTWSDEHFDYFRTSDGHLYYYPRNLAREAAEARHKRNMRRINRMNRALLYFAVVFFTMDVVVVVWLIFGGA